MRPAMKSNNGAPKLANEPRVPPKKRQPPWRRMLLSRGRGSHSGNGPSAEKQQHAVDIVPVADRQQLIAPSLKERSATG